MKKLGLLLMPLMAISFLASCNQSTPTPVVDITHNFHFIGTNCTINGLKDYNHDIYEKDKNVQYTIVPNAGYKLPETVEGVDFNPANGVITISEIKADININVTAIPVPTPGATHVVSFDARGGEVTSKNPLDPITSGSRIATPPTLADRAEYDEQEVTWNTKIDGTGDTFIFDATSGTQVVADMILYAQWGDKIPVTVHFVETSTKTVDKEIGYGERAIYYTPKQQGFTFTGWYEKDPETEETPKEFDFNTPITIETPIYAGWKASAGTTCNVKFNITGCTVTYKGSPVATAGANIEVPQNVDSYYVKFSVKSDSYMKPKTLSLNDGTYTDYSFNIDNGDLFVNLQSNLNVTGTCDMYKTLEECTWSQIKTISEAGEAENVFKIGDEKIVIVNNQPHKVRIIGFNQDVDNNNTPIGITFEFANFISDKNGYSLATLWQDESWMSDTNDDYLNSTIRKNLVGLGDGVNGFFQKEKAVKATDSDYTKPIIDMLPDELSSVLKPTKKLVRIFGAMTEVSDRLFLLNPIEMGYESDVEPSVTYPYYFTHTKKTDIRRVKRQVKGATEAFTDSNGYAITEICLSTGGLSFAGYNNNENELYGGAYWLRSPAVDANGNDQAWIIKSDGTASGIEPVGYFHRVNERAFAVAPAFCI